MMINRLAVTAALLCAMGASPIFCDTIDDAEAKKRGMRTLRQAGLMAIYDGISTIEEVVRETIVEE